MIEYDSHPTKRIEFRNLRIGDIINYDDVLYLFDKIPSGLNSIYVISIDENKHFKIRIESSHQPFDVVGFCDIKKLKTSIDNKEDLKPGDLFVITQRNNNKGCYIFRFDHFTYSNNIVAYNPINNKEIRIPKEFSCTKIENLPF